MVKRRTSRSAATTALKKRRSPLSAKSVWGAAGLFAGAGAAVASGTPDHAIAAWLHGLAPTAMRVSASYLAGFFIGWGARRTLKWTSIATGAALAVAGVYMFMGGEAAWMESWIHSSSAWVDAKVTGAERYLVSLLPSATAATTGIILGFRRK